MFVFWEFTVVQISIHKKNKKTNKGKSYRLKIAKKYKKSQTRGDIFANRRRKNKRK